MRKNAQEILSAYREFDNAIGNADTGNMKFKELADAPPEPPRDQEEIPIVRDRILNAENLANHEHLSMSVYGPTSVFTSESQSTSNRKLSVSGHNPEIVECIRLFFQWQYPDLHAFIFREAFLVDFFNPDLAGVYSSDDVVYAVCAMGALISEDASLAAKAESFYAKASDMLLQNMDNPSISSLQAHLLLGLYDVYNGRNNRGWMRTGDGFRTGFGIGFQLRPKDWAVFTEDPQDHITTDIRSRIYWGSFVVDRFLGLIMGRPSVLKKIDATMPESINMPAMANIEGFTYPGTSQYPPSMYIDVSNPLKQTIKLIEISDTMLDEIFAGDKRQMEENSQLKLLDKYNIAIAGWRENLPPSLSWNRQALRAHGNDHTRMFVRYFYYMVLLCLNRPFVRVAKERDDLKAVINSTAICLEAIADVHAAVSTYTNKHGFSKCSIMIIYSSIICLSLLLLIFDSFEDLQQKELLFEFMTVLKHTLNTWKLSESSRKKILGALRSQWNIDYEEARQEFVNHHRQKDHFGELLPITALTDDTELEFDPSSVGDLDPNTFYIDGLGGPPVFMASGMSDWSTFFPTFDL